MTTIGRAFTGHGNRLTPIRLILAAAVMAEHAIIVTQGPGYLPPLAVHGWSISFAAVNGFFILSGFLIAGSIERRRDIFAYISSRFLRIMPALVFLALVAVIVIGPVFTTASSEAYWSSAETWIFPVQVLAFLDTSQGPYGLFQDLPWAGEFSAPLWTLRYEMLAYVGAAALFFLPLPWGRMSHLVILAATSAIYLAVSLWWGDAPAFVVSSARLSAAFSLGMVAYSWRNLLPVSPWIAVVALPLWWASGSMPWAETFLNLALMSLLFWLALAPLQGLPTWSKIPDWSYGVYIWHYPIMQLTIWINREAEPVLVAAIGFPASILLAAFSWTFVEKPALAQKSRLSRYLRKLFVDGPREK